MTQIIPSPEELVKGQLDAYNARNLQAFIPFFADDIEVYLHPSNLLYSGKIELTQRHATRFEEPDLHAELLNRRVIGNFVIDQEAVTRNFPEGKGQFDVSATYEIVGSKIQRIWYLMGTPRIEGQPTGQS